MEAMKTVVLFALGFFVMTFAIFISIIFTRKNYKIATIVSSFIFIAGGIADIIWASLSYFTIVEEAKVCGDTPGCMIESNMLSSFYGFLIFMGVVLIIMGVISLVHMFRTLTRIRKANEEFEDMQ